MPTEKRERQRRNREKQRRKDRWRSQARGLRRRVGTIITVVVIAAAVWVIFNAITSSEEAAADDLFSQPVACGGERVDRPSDEMMNEPFEEPDDMAIPPDAVVTARIVTSCGDIVVLLDQARAPTTVNSFAFLAAEGYYDGSVFHRIIEDFMVQGGDPTATGTGGPGYRVADEFPEEGFVFEEGTVAMANAGRGTTGSQFFIVNGPDAAHLGPSFNVLGSVVTGFDIVERISEVPVVPDKDGNVSRPTEAVFIESVTVTIEIDS